MHKDLNKLKKYKSDVEWFQEEYSRFKIKYKGEYVAIKSKRLLDHDKDPNLLIRRLPRKSDLVIEYVNEDHSAYIV